MDTVISVSPGGIAKAVRFTPVNSIKICIQETCMNKTVTLEVLYDNEVIFTSTGKWLYPLFDLEEFLKGSTYPAESLVIKDKIVGKASALLILHLGCRKVKAGILSKPAQKVFEDNSVDYTFKERVPLISCKTEVILKNIDSKDTAYAILKERAGR